MAPRRLAAVKISPLWYLEATSGATLPWLIRLRWATAVIEACVVLVVLLFPAIDLPLDHLTWLLPRPG